MASRPTPAALAVAVFLLLLACGGSAPGAAAPAPTDRGPSGDIPDTQAFVAFHFDAGHLTIKVPEGWARTDAGGTTAFTKQLNRVTIGAVSAVAAPTVDSARSQDVPALAAVEKGFQAGQIQTVQRAAGTAVVIAYQADSPPEPVTGKVIRDAAERYEFWHAGTEAVVTLAGPVGSDNGDPWHTITDSLKWD